MSRFEKIIFISMDDTCRGPMAELIMKKVTRHKDIEIISRGLVVLFPEPCNPKAIAVLRNMGIILDNRTSMAFEPESITEKTLILTLGKAEKERIIEEYDPDNVYTLIEFADEPGELVEPFGKEMEVYKQCAEEIEHWLIKVEERLTRMDKEEEEEL